MSVYVEDLLYVAEKEIGYLEKNNCNNLDNKTAAAGTGNYTKYGRDLVKWIGSPYANGVAWCDMFVDWCFVTAFGVDKAKELLGGWSAYTPTSASYFQKMGRWYSSNPQAGDVIFYKNETRICHTGIVYKVDATSVYTIEGNTSEGSDVIPNGGGVARKCFKLNNTRIAGYGRPAYQASAPLEIKKKINYNYGIDISDNQGKIDFKKVAASGIKFAILRATKKNNQADPRFNEYLQGCLQNNLGIAVYKYSYAKSEREAIIEAQSVINLLNGRNYKVWFDVENTDQINALGPNGLSLVINAFCSTIKKAGYEVGIYCNLNWYNNYIQDSIKSSYDFWIARYGKNTGALDEAYKPNKNEVGWQYTSRGSVDGIQGNVDLDVFYGGFVTHKEFPIVRYNTKTVNSYVKILQQELNTKLNARLTVDGLFGNNTLTALKEWQKKNNLEVDGICGPLTWHSLGY